MFIFISTFLFFVLKDMILNFVYPLLAFFSDSSLFRGQMDRSAAHVKETPSL